MKHPGRKALLAVAMASLFGGSLAFLATNTVPVSHAGVTTLPIPAPTTTSPTTPATCYGPGSLTFTSNGHSGPAQGDIKCTATTAGNMIVNATLVSGNASTCTSITFHGSPLGGPVDVPLSDALKPVGAAVTALGSGKKYTGSAKLTGCTGPANLSVSFTLTVIPA